MKPEYQDLFFSIVSGAIIVQNMYYSVKQNFKLGGNIIAAAGLYSLIDLNLRLYTGNSITDLIGVNTNPDLEREIIKGEIFSVGLNYINNIRHVLKSYVDK